MSSATSSIKKIPSKTKGTFSDKLRTVKDKAMHVMHILRHFTPSQFEVDELDDRYSFDILKWRFADGTSTASASSTSTILLPAHEDSIAKKFNSEYYLSAFIHRRIIHQVSVAMGVFLLILSSCGLGSKEMMLYLYVCLPPLVLSFGLSFIEGIARYHYGDIGKTGTIPGAVIRSVIYVLSLIDIGCSLAFISLATRSRTNLTLLATYPMRYYTQYDMRHPFAIQVLLYGVLSIAHAVISALAVDLSSSDRGFAIFVALTLTPSFIFMCYSTLRTEYGEFVPKEAAKAECRRLKQFTEQFLSLVSALVPRGIAEGLLKALVQGKSINFHRLVDDCSVMFLEVSRCRMTNRADGKANDRTIGQTVCENESEEDLIDCIAKALRPIRAICASKGVCVVKMTGADWIMASDRGDQGAMACFEAARGIASSRPIFEAGLAIKAGICRGKVYSGILGLILPRFDLLGDTVNTASRLMKAAEPGFACIAYGSGLDDLGNESVLQLKGKGEVKARVVKIVGEPCDTGDQVIASVTLAAKVSSVLAQEDIAFSENNNDRWYNPKAKHYAHRANAVNGANGLLSVRSGRSLGTSAEGQSRAPRSIENKSMSSKCESRTSEGFNVLWPREHALYLADSFDRSRLYVITAVIILCGFSLTPISTIVRGRPELLYSPVCISLCVVILILCMSAAVAFKILTRRRVPDAQSPVERSSDNSGRMIAAYITYMCLIALAISASCYVAGVVVKEPIWFFYDSFLTTTLILPKLLYVGIVVIIVVPTITIVAATATSDSGLLVSLAALAGAGILFECTKMWYVSSSSESAMKERMRINKLEERTRKTNARFAELYRNMVPRKYAATIQDMVMGEPLTKVSSRSFVHRDCSILMADVVGFTELCSKYDACAVVSRVDSLFTMVDEVLMKKFPLVSKLKTAGDAFFAVSNVLDDTDFHQDTMLDFAITILDLMKIAAFQSSPLSQRDLTSTKGIGEDFQLRLRIGMCTGETTLGIFSYDGTISYDCYGPLVAEVEHIQTLAPPSGIAFEEGSFNLSGNKERLIVSSEDSRGHRGNEIRLTTLRLKE
jgi:class 3 adenylate cyclase